MWPWFPKESKNFQPGGRRSLFAANHDGSAWPKGLSPVWHSNLQPDFNVRICDYFDASSSAVLRELDESNRFVQKSAESTSI
jgi:hypothetical protein